MDRDDLTSSGRWITRGGPAAALLPEVPLQRVSARRARRDYAKPHLRHTPRKYQIGQRHTLSYQRFRSGTVKPTVADADRGRSLTRPTPYSYVLDSHPHVHSLVD